MAKLEAKERDALPSQSFAGPDRSFPIEDHVHAMKALQLAPRSRAAGHITVQQERRIVAAAHAKLNEANPNGPQMEQPTN